MPTACECAGPPHQPTVSKERSRAAKTLQKVFETSFKAVYEVHTALAALQSAGDGDDICMSNEEIATVHTAYKQLQSALDPSALGCLFEQDAQVMESFLNSCAQQARSGIGARHSSLHEEVCSHQVPLCGGLASVITLQIGNGCVNIC
jgi:hypothetical protein